MSDSYYTKLHTLYCIDFKSEANYCLTIGVWSTQETACLTNKGKWDLILMSFLENKGKSTVLYTNPYLHYEFGT